MCAGRETPQDIERWFASAIAKLWPGQSILGGALTAGNLALGAMSVITARPAISLDNVSVSLPLVGSTFTGLNALLGAVEKIGEELKK